MNKEFTSLGLMSGTSGDGIDASIICSNGQTEYTVLIDKFYEYNNETFKNIHNLKEKVHNLQDLIAHKKELLKLERDITLFHAKAIEDICTNYKVEVVGFHGQTIYHNPEEKISKQLGDGFLLSQLIKKNLVYNFRLNDIKNGGEGAPLTPIYHQLIATQNKFDLPVCILNIGGISNITVITKPIGKNGISSKDIGPGNCLIDTWVRKNTNKRFDEYGNLASRGTTNFIILEQAQELFSNKTKSSFFSLDVNDFDISFARGLSLEDGASTLTDFTAGIISANLTTIFEDLKKNSLKILITGGGRKNKTLIGKIKENISQKIILNKIDNLGINGDFIESQAFAFLAIRSILKMPISFPKTTGCKNNSLGGELIKFK